MRATPPSCHKYGNVDALEFEIDLNNLHGREPHIIICLEMNILNNKMFLISIFFVLVHLPLLSIATYSAFKVYFK